MDNRYKILKERLSLLSLTQLQRIEADIDHVCFDTYNYDSENNKFCPLAVALNLHNTIENPSEEIVIDILSKVFNPVNIIGGAEGNFYKDNRKEDLLNVVRELINDR